jgi:hypothetical protein
MVTAIGTTATTAVTCAVIGGTAGAVTGGIWGGIEEGTVEGALSGAGYGFCMGAFSGLLGGLGAAAINAIGAGGGGLTTVAIKVGEYLLDASIAVGLTVTVETLGVSAIVGGSALLASFLGGMAGGSSTSTSASSSSLSESEQQQVNCLQLALQAVREKDVVALNYLVTHKQAELGSNLELVEKLLVELMASSDEKNGGLSHLMRAKTSSDQFNTFHLVLQLENEDDFVSNECSIAAFGKRNHLNAFVHAVEERSQAFVRS